MDYPFLRFLFIVAVPVVVVAGGLLTLFAVGALFDFLENQEAAARRIEALFRRPPKAPKTPGPEHYYKPYWERR
ncbi:MAG TPA: hypothetical protein VLI67_08285 [Vicinamibacteria bacterium]|nr:hypothetical protein [Vicinamibacteria bacterium]